MNVVLITGPDMAHRYMANRLCAELPVAGVVVDHGRPMSALARGRQLWRRYTVGQIAGRVTLKILRAVWRDNARRRAEVLRVLGTDRCAGFEGPSRVHHVAGINTAEGHRAVSALAPDLLLVFGTGIVGRRILELARVLALNVHTGISPQYRGAECTFWPLHNGEPHMLGATVHECTAQVDGGRILGTARATLEAGDDQHAAYARCVVAAADLYVRVVSEVLAGRREGSLQDLRIGCEYRAHMRGVRAELRTRRLIRQGLIRRHVESRPAWVDTETMIMAGSRPGYGARKTTSTQ
jgi:methionyl-tRNA formyltransferase